MTKKRVQAVIAFALLLAGYAGYAVGSSARCSGAGYTIEKLSGATTTESDADLLRRLGLPTEGTTNSN